MTLAAAARPTLPAELGVAGARRVYGKFMARKSGVNLPALPSKMSNQYAYHGQLVIWVGLPVLFAGE
jgi:hypothetical protein